MRHQYCLVHNPAKKYLDALKTSIIQVLVLSNVSTSSSFKIVQYETFVHNDGVGTTHAKFATT